jgi:sortase (surface protein transpeptidase)
MAVIVFVFGIMASLQTIRTNHNAAAQVAALARKANNPANAGNSVVPGTTKPSSAAVSNYVVAPNLPRYLKIPKLGVDARVLQTGVTSAGALGTPPNVYDTAWYTGSAEPGQPGATLIDGHVSSWTTDGVFYGLRTLQPGDDIQIVRGDGTVFNYQVVKTVTYPDNGVNMQAAMTPVTPGTSGLNLISCTGDVIPGTSLFNARIVVFAEEVSSS